MNELEYRIVNKVIRYTKELVILSIEGLFVIALLYMTILMLDGSKDKYENYIVQTKVKELNQAILEKNYYFKQLDLNNQEKQSYLQELKDKKDVELYIEDRIINASKPQEIESRGFILGIKISDTRLFDKDITKLIITYIKHMSGLQDSKNIKVGYCKTDNNELTYPAIMNNDKIVIFPVYSLGNSGEGREIIKDFFKYIKEESLR